MKKVFIALLKIIAVFLCALNLVLSIIPLLSKDLKIKFSSQTNPIDREEYVVDTNVEYVIKSKGKIISTSGVYNLEGQDLPKISHVDISFKVNNPKFSFLDDQIRGRDISEITTSTKVNQFIDASNEIVILPRWSDNSQLELMSFDGSIKNLNGKKESVFAIRTFLTDDQILNATVDSSNYILAGEELFFIRNF